MPQRGSARASRRRRRSPGDLWVLNIKRACSLGAADGSLLFTCVKKQMAWTCLMVGEGRMAAGSCQFASAPVCMRSPLALVLCRRPPTPSACGRPRRRQEVRPRRSRPACCERRGHRARSQHQLLDT